MSWCETEMQKYMPLVKQDVMKFEVFILGGQRIDQKRSKGWWRGSRERIEMEAQKVTELTIEEEDKEHLHLPLLVSSRCVSSEFPTRFCSKALQQEVLKLGVQRLGKGSCSKRLVKYIQSEEWVWLKWRIIRTIW